MRGNATGGGGGIGGAGGGVGAGGSVGGALGGVGRGMSRVHDDLPERIHRAVVTLLVPDEVPQKLLTKATEEGLEEASDALPGRGTVRAEGALGRKGIRKRVVVTLTVSGATAEEAWARLAADAFAKRFLDVMAKKGHEAERVA